MFITDLPIILRRTSPTPMGLNPGFCLRVLTCMPRVDLDYLDLRAVHCKEFSSCLIKAFLKSTAPLPNMFVHKMRRQSSAPKRERPEEPFVFIADFCIKSSSMSSKMTAFM